MSLRPRPAAPQHDAQFDYYGKSLATCSSDKTIKIYDVSGEEQKQTAELTGHDGPVWEVDWAHPKFGVMLASCSYDKQVIVHRQSPEGVWSPVHYYRAHESSVNAVKWAPHEHGLVLACASSDGRVSVLTHKADDTWAADVLEDCTLGCNAVTWAPYSHVGSVEGDSVVKRVATGGCDSNVRVFRQSEGAWALEATLSNASAGGNGHSDWVRDVAWAPGSGMPSNVIASCSEDCTVVIWKQGEPRGEWRATKLPAFDAPVWRVSWSVTGNMLAVSSGDNKVTLWKESLDGKWT